MCVCERKKVYICCTVQCGIDSSAARDVPSCLSLFLLFLLGWRRPNVTAITRLKAAGEHPTNHVGHNKLSQTVADHRLTRKSTPLTECHHMW